MPLPKHVSALVEREFNPKVERMLYASGVKPNKATREAIRDFQAGLLPLAEECDALGKLHAEKISAFEREISANMRELSANPAEFKRRQAELRASLTPDTTDILEKAVDDPQSDFAKLIKKHEVSEDAEELLKVLHNELALWVYAQHLYPPGTDMRDKVKYLMLEAAKRAADH